MQVVAGGFHFLVLLESGDVYAWGDNQHGQVGDGTTKRQPAPTRVLRGAKFVAAGWNHSLAIMRDGDIYVWGCNTSGQLGDGSRTSRPTPEVVMQANGKDVLYEVISCAGGKEHSVAIVREPGKSRSHCWAWGGNVSGLQGCNTPATRTEASITGLSQLVGHPVLVEEDVKAVAGGMTHTLAIKSNGDCVAWGRNTHGQLGDGTTVSRLSAVKVLEKVRSVAAGVDYSLAVLENGELFSWGYNSGGRLGDGTTLDRLHPTKVMENVRSISAGHCHAAAILDNMECFGWGTNLHGCICEHGDPEVHKPLSVVCDISSVAAGGCHTIAVTATGEFCVWGRDWHSNLHSLKAFKESNAKASFNPGPPRDEFKAMLDAPPVGPDQKILALHGPAAQSALTDGQLVSGGLEDEELPPPPQEEVEAVEEGPVEEEQVLDEAPQEQEEAPPEESLEHELSPEELEAFWRQGPAQRFGKDIHRRIHSKARQTGRNYLVKWHEFRRQAYKDSNGEALSKEHEEDTLRNFHAEIAKRAHMFRKANARVGGATLYGWTHEDCLPSTGVLALESELVKAAKAETGDPDLFQDASPSAALYSPKHAAAS